MIVFVLETYDERACVDGTFNPGRWQKEFLVSRTGRIVGIIANGRSFHVVNSTCKNIMKHINRHNPDLVVICGRKAQSAVNGQCKVPVIKMPHPAWRVLRNIDVENYKRTVDMYLNK